MYFYPRRPLPTICLSLALNLAACGLPMLAMANPSVSPIDETTGQSEGIANQRTFSFVPPNRGIPGRREGGGTRGDECTQGNLSRLVALMPEKSLGLTTESYPQFFWFIPKTTARFVEFKLYDVDKQHINGTPIYQTMFAITGEPGIASLKLPSEAGIPPLESGQDYRWSLSLVCNPENRTRDDIRVFGGVERVSLNLYDASRLEHLSQRDRLSVYEDKGLWFDALTTLASLRACDPSDTELSNRWSSLLEAVKLQDYAEQPLMQQCLHPSATAISTRLEK